jgi:hypothetical protein
MGMKEILKGGLDRIKASASNTDEDGPGPISGVKKVANTIGRGVSAANKGITDAVQSVAEPTITGIMQAGKKVAGMASASASDKK